MEDEQEAFEWAVEGAVRFVGHPRSKKMLCLLCDTHLTGSQSRARAHILGLKGKGVGACVVTAKRPTDHADVIQACTETEQQSRGVTSRATLGNTSASKSEGTHSVAQSAIAKLYAPERHQQVVANDGRLCSLHTLQCYHACCCCRCMMHWGFFLRWKAYHSKR